MSVHQEYQRALRVVEVRLTEAGDAVAARWLAAFSGVEVDGARDLSTSARAALDLLARVEADLALDAPPNGGARVVGGPDAAQRLALLRDACHHLQAHCRAILGLGSADCLPSADCLRSAD